MRPYLIPGCGHILGVGGTNYQPTGEKLPSFWKLLNGAARVRLVLAAGTALAVLSTGAVFALTSLQEAPAAEQVPAGRTLQSVAHSAVGALELPEAVASPPPVVQAPPAQVVLPRTPENAGLTTDTRKLTSPNLADSPPNYGVSCPMDADARFQQTSEVVCSVQSFGSYTGPVTLTCTPEGGLGCRVDPTPLVLIPNKTVTVKIVITVPGTVAAGMYTLTIGTDGPNPEVTAHGSRYAMRVIVPPYPSFTIGCPTNPPLPEPATFCILTAEAGFSGSVNASIQPQRPGMSVSSSAAPPGGPMAGLIRIAFDPAQLGPGTHTFTVTGSSGEISRSSQLQITI